MRVDAEAERDRIETTAGRLGKGMGSEVVIAEMIGGGATIEDVTWVKAAADDELVDLAMEREVVVEDALLGIVPRSSVPRLLRSPTLSSSATAHSEISWQNVNPIIYYAQFPLHCQRRVLAQHWPKVNGADSAQT